MGRSARSSQAVLCSIPQPSATLFQRFDWILLVARRGRTAYLGPSAGRPTSNQLHGSRSVCARSGTTMLSSLVLICLPPRVRKTRTRVEPMQPCSPWHDRCYFFWVAYETCRHQRWNVDAVRAVTLPGLVCVPACATGSSRDPRPAWPDTNRVFLRPALARSRGDRGAWTHCQASAVRVAAPPRRHKRRFPSRQARGNWNRHHWVEGSEQSNESPPTRRALQLIAGEAWQCVFVDSGRAREGSGSTAQELAAALLPS